MALFLRQWTSDTSTERQTQFFQRQWFQRIGIRLMFWLVQRQIWDILTCDIRLFEVSGAFCPQIVIATSKWQITGLLVCLEITLYTVISIQKRNGPREPLSYPIPRSLRPPWYKTMISITYTWLIYKKESDIFL